MIPSPEFSRTFDLRSLPHEPFEIGANATERRALARRFDLVAINSLRARVELEAQGAEVSATGQLSAAVVQSCAVSGEDLAVRIEEPFTVRFTPATTVEGAVEEVELTPDDLDAMEYQGTTIDLGEAVAQTLALAIDPFAVGPQAEAARKAAGLGEPDLSGPFAALAALKRKPN